MTTDDHAAATAPTRPGDIEPSPPELLREPLEFLFAEHYRHRQMCKILEYLSAAMTFDAALISAIDDFLNNDLTLHIIDEEADLFPLLRRRCEPEDDIEDILGRLSADHALDQELARTVRSLFAAAIAQSQAPSLFPGGAEALLKLARQEKHHMALENAVVMPLARRRLLPEDLAALGARLVGRRGVSIEQG